MALPNVLIVGGTSGLGLELAIRLSQSSRVVITGRENRAGRKELEYERLPLGEPHQLESFFGGMLARRFGNDPVDLVIYAAGYRQKKNLASLTGPEIVAMNSVGLIAPEILVSRVMVRQQTLPAFLVITSTSALRPRALEGPYAGTKAGLAHYAHSVSRSARVHKVLVAAPGGMNTLFNRGTDEWFEDGLDPGWVAEQILLELDRPYAKNGCDPRSFNFRSILIERSADPKVEVLEEE